MNRQGGTSKPSMDRPTQTQVGTATHRKLLAEGWTDPGSPEGDATDPNRIMVPQGYVEPKRQIRRRRGEQAPADRRGR
jgi:hypothetical protein